MSKQLSIVIILLALVSCVTTTEKYQLNVDCVVPTEILFKSLTEQLMFEGLHVTQSEVKLGYLRAESAAGHSNMINGTIQRIWEFHVIDYHVTAYAKTLHVSKGRFGNVVASGSVYYRDDTCKDWTWYWNVRNRLRSFCGNDIKIIRTDVKNIY